MKPSKVLTVFVCSVVGLVPTLSSAQFNGSGNIIQNGGFEQHTGFSSTDLSPWVFTGGILETAGGCQAEDGVNCVGVISGQLYQNVTTIPGQVYQLSFYVAGWAPDGPLPGTYNLGVLWNGSEIGTTSFLVTDQTFANMGWSYRSFLFSATGDTAQLAFINPNAISNPYIPVLDNVELMAVPEPSCIALLTAGMFTFLGFGFYKKYTANTALAPTTAAR